MLIMNAYPAAKSRQTNVASLGEKDPAGSPDNTTAKISGLGPMTRVTTAFGQVYAQTLRERDRVRTRNGEFVTITKVDRITLDADYLHYHPAAQPILVRAGSLARGIPAADILLAPHQRFDAAQKLAYGGVDKAIDALRRPHVCRKTENMITYTTIYCEKPTTVCCEGVWVETAS
jgi:hypothetical protein